MTPYLIAPGLSSRYRILEAATGNTVEECATAQEAIRACEAHTRRSQFRLLSGRALDATIRDMPTKALERVLGA